MTKEIELMPLYVDTDEDEPLLSCKKRDISLRRLTLMNRIISLRDSLSSFKLFWHNFFFQSVFYNEAAYQAFLNYAEALTLTENVDDAVLQKLEQLVSLLPQLGVFTLDPELKFLDTLGSLNPEKGTDLFELKNCLQFNDAINQEALHPAVIYAWIIIATALIIASPAILPGLVALYGVIAAIFIYVEVGPSSDKYYAMCSETERCSEAYKKSLSSVAKARQHYGIYQHADENANSPASINHAVY